MKEINPQNQNVVDPKMTLLLTRYPPLRDTADNSVTVSRNMLLLQKELERDNPRKEMCCLCLDRYS